MWDFFFQYFFGALQITGGLVAAHMLISGGKQLQEWNAHRLEDQKKPFRLLEMVKKSGRLNECEGCTNVECVDCQIRCYEENGYK